MNKKQLLQRRMANGFVNTASSTDGSCVLKACYENKKIEDYKIYGNSVQDGVPTPDTPVEVQSVGEKTKNLFDVSTAALNKALNWALGVDFDENASYRSDYIEVTESEQYTGSGRMQVMFYDSNKIYLGTLNVDGVTLVKSTSTYFTTFTVPSDLQIKYLKFSSRVGICNVVPENFQLEEGSTATDYEPYGYKIPVKIASKNRFDGTLKNGYGVYGTTNSQRGQEFTSAITKVTDYILLKANQPCTVSYDYESLLSSNQRGYCYYDLSKVAISSSTVTSYVVSNKKVTLVPDTDCYLRIAFDMNVTNIQIETDSTATSYEPYQEPVEAEIYLDAPLRRIDDYNDYIDFERGKVIRIIGEEIWDGSKEYTKDTWWTNAYYVSPGLSIGKKSNYVLCNRQVSLPLNNITSGSYTALTNNNGYTEFGADASIIGSNATEFKTWVTNNPIVFNYKLPNQISNNITLPSILTKYGTNIIEIDTATAPSSLELTYRSKEKR